MKPGVSHTLNPAPEGSYPVYPSRPLADLVVALYQDERLCLVHDSEADREPQILYSMGLFHPKG